MTHEVISFICFLSLSLALSIYIETVDLWFLYRLFCQQKEDRSDDKQNNEKEKSDERIVELNFQDNRHTRCYFNKSKACDSQLKFVFIDIRRAHYQLHSQCSLDGVNFMTHILLLTYTFDSSFKKQ